MGRAIGLATWEHPLAATPLRTSSLALSGEGGGYAGSDGEVVIVDLIVNIIDCPKLDYVND